MGSKRQSGMDGAELDAILKTLGWTPQELARRLSVRNDSVYAWLTNRRPIPQTLADWLRLHRTAQGSVPPLPENWRSGG
jgi:DNA-binding transcriptional regulator YiaG